MVKLLPNIFRQSDDDRRAANYKSLINYEARIGGGLFGSVPAGHRREFFCLDEHTWVWHEEWTENGQRKAVTTRYDVRPNGILKAQGSQYQLLSGQETMNLYRAIELYEKRIGQAYDQMLQTA
ncbi:MAG TPA: hypothetical protein VLH86_04190 [Patescibacteria group bacterium]|nr:hypothetical protein [Patescibacteria group bacterium]